MGYNSIQGVYVFGEDNTLVYNPDEHVRFPQVQEEFTTSNAGCVRSAPPRL
jgi:hypothetical protein